jgi:hypothetical protein
LLTIQSDHNCVLTLEAVKVDFQLSAHNPKEDTFVEYLPIMVGRTHPKFQEDV